ncbi:hypothetical protein KGQ20_02200 [Catenulispora sp. NF23]|uniref:Uncharacterized protein n=1 Tax=Catenulispora pinistramenti TaxID=2705254 RepID=A0ABS5KIQ6_9ACTN|nr:hypothetical protein [Catenulispora pinistramenti]MBS2531577.1 hypothetical protein [Catenulispora pinistramenti]MBS2546173.1 hypothetical protein [Catenulispora pinistramenti]
MNQLHRGITPAHAQAVTNHYTIHYPDHAPRESDPHYKDFEHYRATHVDTAACQFALDRGGDTTECAGGLELHHAIVEFSLANSIDLELLERDYPGISDPAKLGAWIESGKNLAFLCAKHHRGHGGIHHASASDWVAEKYIRNLIE